MSDQCALDESGSLKEAKDVEFFYSKSETTPLPSSGAAASATTFSQWCYVTEPQCGKRKRNVEKLYASIAAEQRDEYGAIVKKRRPCQQGQKSSRSAKKPKTVAAGIDSESDPDDGNFVSDGSSTEGSQGDDTEVDDLEAQPSNTEISSLQNPCQQPGMGQESERGEKLLLETSKMRTAHRISEHDLLLQPGAQSSKIMIHTGSQRFLLATPFIISMKRLNVM
ncbi:hypothetical protein EDB83DRAFT_2317944 [Lactarius deliciosus]|nr:hypothetical protein EDB83DRAFT_2317944 [Lactarius deliciosus]